MNIDLGRVIPLYRGDYENSTEYEQNDIVRFNSGLYWHASATKTTAVSPENNTVWSLIVTDGAKGDKGDKGDAFTYSDFSPAQLESLRGPQGIQGQKGDTGDTGPQGEKGEKGDPGDSVTIDSTLSSTSENPVQNKVTKAVLDGKGTYSKPSGGIPKSDLAGSVQTSLDKADTALQEHQDISGKLNIAQGASNAGKFLVVGANGNITLVTMTAWQGGSY